MRISREQAGEPTVSAPAPNSRIEVERRRAAQRWMGVWLILLLLARSAFSLLAQALGAGAFALSGVPDPWLAAAPWFPVYGTLVDVGCLAALWWLTRREGIALSDLVGFDRSRWRRDVLIGLGLIPVSLLLILTGIWISTRLIYGTVQTPPAFGALPLLPSLYSVLVFPVVWGVAEQMTYNGYLLPRFQVWTRSTAVAVLIVSIPWSFPARLPAADARAGLLPVQARVPDPLLDLPVRGLSAPTTIAAPDRRPLAHGRRRPVRDSAASAPAVRGRSRRQGTILASVPRGLPLHLEPSNDDRTLPGAYGAATFSRIPRCGVTCTSRTTPAASAWSQPTPSKRSSRTRGATTCVG